MQKVRDRLVESNDLEGIDDKIKNDEVKQTYFGHRMDGEVRIIQTLNEVHRYCMDPNVANSKDPEINIDDGVLDDVSEESKEYNVDENDDTNDKNEVSDD